MSYAHNDLKKAAAIAAEKRQKILKANKDHNKKGHSGLQQPPTAASKIKPEVKQENGAVKTEVKVEVKPQLPPVPVQPQPPVAAASKDITAASNETQGPLDLQKRSAPSPAYSDISDEEPVTVPLPKTQPLPASNLQNIPSLNNLKIAKPLQPPPPAHSNSLKKPLSLEESLKKPPQFMPPGFPHGFPGLGTGLPAHLAAAVASGRYPPGFMPVAPPGFPSPVSAASRPPSGFMGVPQPQAASSSASQKLQELQDRVMASARPSMHLGGPPPGSALAPPTSSAASFSSLARDLLPPAHYNSLSRMAGSLNAAGKLRSGSLRNRQTD